MNEEKIGMLVRLRLLRVVAQPDEEYDRLELLGDVARLVGATPEELGEALRRVSACRYGDSA